MHTTDGRLTPELLTEITAHEEEQRSAFLHQDIARLGEMWSDGFLVHSPMNKVLGKEKALELLAAGVIAHTAYDGEIEHVERRKDLILVMGSERVINGPGTPVLNRRYTNVWRHEDGAWRLLLRHANLTP